MKKMTFSSLVVCILLADETSFNAENNASGGGALKTYELEATEISASIDEISKYQTGTSIGKSLLQASPNANGDITSALKILPNVQYDNAQLSSHTPGEIDPANISISGGLFYQNNFTLDGFNMNNDLDPIGGGVDGTGGASQGLRGGRSQGFNVDTSLLDSISVLDSNIGAAYGGFTGGVVEANVRNPRTDRFHFDINYQHTSNKLTTYHIDKNFEENLANSTDEKFQPKFTKELVKASLEGWLNEKFGIIGAFSTTRSKIPLNGYSSVYHYNGTEAFQTRNQTRRSDNYYLKMIYNISSDFSLEANLGYMPQFNTYFSAIAKDSFYTYESGGYQSGLKGIWENKMGVWTNALSYSFLEHSRNGKKNYFLNWRYSVGDKNWASNRAGLLIEGSPADVNQVQHTANYKSNMQFKAVEFLNLEHKFNLGTEFGYQYVAREIMEDYYWNVNNTLADLGANSCNMSDFFCSNAPTNNGWQGQYIKQLNILKKSLTKLDVQTYAFYAENDMKIFEFDKIGRLNARVGLRFDGDNYMDKSSLAPRFSLAYVMPWKKHQSRLNFGANRYYGRNLFSYRLYDSILAATKRLTRADLNSPWIESDVNAKSQYSFNKLNIPYSDELMVGLSQDIGVININAKYINRQGKDEITQRGRYGNYYYSNEGRSKSDVISISIENNALISSYNVNHHFLLAFDKTLTSRTYNLFTSDEAYINDPDILYDGKVIKYSQRPTENFARPYTIRLNTTQTMKLGSTRLLWNNFFRYRSGYDRMVILSRTSPNYNTTIANTMSQYGRYHFKGVFNWDMRLGFEFRVDSLLKKEVDAGMFYVNVDIINVLNLKNMTTISGAYGNMATGSLLSAAAAYPVYDIGRQFWLQFGYKY